LTMNFAAWEALARTASFHTHDVKAQEGRETANEEDMEKQKFISRLCTISTSSLGGFRSILPKKGATKGATKGLKLVFNKDNTEISYMKFKLRFTESEDLSFYLSMVRPYVNEIYFIETHFWRVHLIEIAEALIGTNTYTCIDENTLLKFDKTGNDNAYGTLLEYLGPVIKRIEVDDEFAAQLREPQFKFDYCKVKAQHRAEMYYTKSYFDINSKEYDLLKVCNLKNMIMYRVEDFSLVPLENVNRISMSLLDEEDQSVMLQGAQYLQYLAPNLERLVLVQNKALLFSDPEKAFQAGIHVQQFFDEKYKGVIADCFPHVNIDARLELSLYSKDDALKNKINWFTELQRDYPDLKRVSTEYRTEAYEVVFPGNKSGDSVIIRIHPYDRDYNENEKNNFPHPTPIQIL